MSAQRIIDYCWWYLDHLVLFLIPAAIFDIVCWIAIVVSLRRRRLIRIGRSQASGSAMTVPRAGP